MTDSSSSSKNDDFSQTSTNCNNEMPNVESEHNLCDSKPKFEKKIPGFFHYINFINFKKIIKSRNKRVD